MERSLFFCTFSSYNQLYICESIMSSRGIGFASVLICGIFYVFLPMVRQVYPLLSEGINVFVSMEKYECSDQKDSGFFNRDNEEFLVEILF